MESTPFDGDGLWLVAGYEPQATAVELAQLGGEGLLRGTSCPP
ncbi:MAG: hypothetical protein ACLVF4_10375 [Ruminococcus sp.]|nr:hypothetical protein [Ruminococcus sp.]